MYVDRHTPYLVTNRWWYLKCGAVIHIVKLSVLSGFSVQGRLGSDCRAFAKRGSIASNAAFQLASYPGPVRRRKGLVHIACMHQITMVTYQRSHNL